MNWVIVATAAIVIVMCRKAEILFEFDLRVFLKFSVCQVSK
jgi:hypothetical protein